MKNNVYVRSNRSIYTISITRIFFLLPLIAYGFYKNGIHLYLNDYINIKELFLPLIIIFGGGIIGAIVNIIYELLIKRNKQGFTSLIFSSFHVEYGMILGCLIPISINLAVYFSCMFVIFMISKFLNNRINTICVCFITIYIVAIMSGLMTDFHFENLYELDKQFSLDFMDYLIGKAPGGIASTHIILLTLAFFGIHFTNNNKTAITTSSVIIIIIAYIALAIVKDISFNTLLFSNNILFIMTYVATDSVTSCYTIKGKITYGILIGLLTFGFYFVKPILAPYIAILIVSLFNNLIDRKLNAIPKTN